MVTLRRLDAFAKTRPDLRQQSPVGGFITLFAAFIAGLLFIGQIALYISGTTSHSLILSRSTTVPLSLLEHQGRNKNKLPSHRGLISLKIHVTFPHIHCRNLDIVHDGASLSSGELYKIHGKTSLRLTKPTKKELQTTLGYQPTQHYDGCTIKGELRPPIVAGILSIGLSRQAWASASTALSTGFGNTVSESVQENLKQFNASHYIHAIEFGRTFSKQREKPLHKVRHVIENDFHGIAVSSLQVKLVPTVQYGFFGSEYSYQTSVVDIILQPQALVSRGQMTLPGIVLSYDFAPLTVQHSEGRDNFFVFLSSLISILGGVFVTLSLVTGLVVNTAQEIAKKID